MLKSITINTGVFLSVNFSTPGPIPGYPRIHDTDTTWVIVKNYTYVPLDYTLHPVGPALAHFHG